jgi:hypothetical protein
MYAFPSKKELNFLYFELTVNSTQSETNNLLKKLI